MLFLSRFNSATWNEADHTCTGYMQWRTGDFCLNPQHPPLIKFMALCPARSACTHSIPGDRPAWYQAASPPITDKTIRQTLVDD
jgi:hypothetical protein